MAREYLMVALLLTGCLANNGLGSYASSEKNIANMAELSVGMSQNEVLWLMRQPYSRQQLTIGEDQYDFWFYVTKATVLGQSRMVPHNLTPLAFKNGVLIGWGFDYFNGLRKRQCAAEQPKDSPPMEERELEEKALEKALEAPGKGGKPSTYLSMCSRPKSPVVPAEEGDAEVDEGAPQGDVQWDEGDEEMQDSDSEENFNFW
jgi:hypothetical protein